MAGVSGLASRNRNRVEEMLDRIRHRGPDSIEIHESDGFTGGVVASELSAARGNGFARDGDTVVLFDGEIYNRRNDNKSDAEVVLELHKKHGRTFPRHLEGVFAGALWNGDEVILFRDAVGVRPLYWGMDGEGRLCFSSEMKSMVDIAVSIRELGPSTSYSSKFGIAGYIPHYPDSNIPDSPEKAADRLRDLLFESVERRLEDGAVGGMLLSGGLDSSIIASIANKLKPGIPTFTVGLEGTDAPDVENAKLMAEYLGVSHSVVMFDIDDITEMVPKAVDMLESFDEDCISGIIANLNASAAATTATNCILSGEGGDELFGGYHLIKKLEHEDERLRMMHKLIEVAYNTALQRLDRGMMGNSINYRTPFIDPAVVSFALQIPVRWKIHENANGELVEKWLLREAFKNMLPEAIYKRPKLRFSGGTGTDNVMDQVARSVLEDDEFTEATRKTPAGYYLNSPKELWYYRIFRDRFPGEHFECLVGRWDPHK